MYSPIFGLKVKILEILAMMCFGQKNKSRIASGICSDVILQHCHDWLNKLFCNLIGQTNCYFYSLNGFIYLINLIQYIHFYKFKYNIFYVYFIVQCNQNNIICLNYFLFLNTFNLPDGNYAARTSTNKPISAQWPLPLRKLYHTI